MDLHAHSAGVRRLVHEFNNLLFVIGGHCELLHESCATDQARADLAAVTDAVARATALTAELRAMAIDVARADAVGTRPTVDAIPR